MEGEIMNLYVYRGPVLYFGKVVSNNWIARTYAESEAKAISNFKYQFKNKVNMVPSVGGITLSGSISFE
jgi:hypothetical protein